MTLFVGELAMFRRELESPPTTSRHFATADAPTTPPAKRRRGALSTASPSTDAHTRRSARVKRDASETGTEATKRALVLDE